MDTKVEKINVVQRPSYYFYRRPLVKGVIKLIDAFGFSFFSGQSEQIIVKGKVLVANLGGAGDLILSEPFLSALSAITGGPVDLVCSPGREQSLLSLSAVNKIYNLELPWHGGRLNLWQSLRAAWRLGRQLRSEQYLAAFDLKGDPVVIGLLRLAGIRYRLGFSNGGLGWLLTHPFSQPRHLRRYKVDLSLLAPLVGYSFNYDRPPALVVAADPDFFINYRNYQPQLPVITVHLGASVPARLWPLPYWIKLLSLLVGRYNIAVIGGLSEQSNFNQLPPELKDKIMNFLGRSWQETAQTLKNSSVFIGANSGPAHLAAAVGCPVISIFSAANDPVEWAPEQAKVLIFAPACAGCERLVCSDPHCLKNITPAQVLVELETFNLLVQVK